MVILPGGRVAIEVDVDDGYKANYFPSYFPSVRPGIRSFSIVYP